MAVSTGLVLKSSTGPILSVGTGNSNQYCASRVPTVNDNPTSDFHQYCQRIPHQYDASTIPMYSTAPVVNTVWPPTFPPGL